ncbi:ABC transporter substrate-binding protein [Salinirussus salinus]|jgi:peptide/nickel transport system substrate-binding protein|uniref:ABC transporter substrate-binding protein n=1 Tax=Salinirussus salinus TaxID=1198300 RepID=UPI00135C59F7|nr:ABC transporter substrate-binding protein [Salinirussus salinus]
MPRDESESQVDRRTLLKAVGGAAATVSVAGCGGAQNTPTEGDGGDDGGDTQDDTDTPMDDDETEDTPTDDGGEESFSVGVTLGQMDSGLDPHDHAETPTNIIVSQAYEGLMGRDKEGAIIAKLATEWERVEPGTARFTLRDGVTFQNGDDLTSEDVRYSIRRIETEEVGGALPQDGDLAGTGTLENVEAGDGEVTVTFGGLNPIVFQLFATNGQVMQQSWVEENGTDFINRNVNGTGPFQLTGYESGTSVSYENYGDYWGEPAAADELTITASSESSTRVNQLLAEETDIVTNVPPQEISRVQSSDVASVNPVPSTRIIFLQMRYDIEPFSSQQFRQAMNYAVDVQSIIENVLQGFGEITGQPTLSQFTGHNPDIEPYGYDPDEAERLVEESGHAGVDITLQTPIGRYLRDVEIAQAAANQIDSLSNVNCELQQREFNSLVQDVTAPNIEDRPPFTLLGWGNGEFDAAQTIIPLLTSGGPLTVLQNEEVDSLIEQAQSEPDPQEREQILQQTNQLLHDLAPWVFLHQQFSVYGVSNGIQWQPRPDELIDVWTATQN